jgi:hypothetical protein
MTKTKRPGIWWLPEIFWRLTQGSKSCDPVAMQLTWKF